MTDMIPPPPHPLQPYIYYRRSGVEKQITTPQNPSSHHQHPHTRGPPCQESWGSKDIEHIGSAHDDAELEALKVVARERLAAGKEAFDLGLDGVVPGRPLQIV